MRSIVCRASWEIETKLSPAQWHSVNGTSNEGATKVSAQIGNYTSNRVFLCMDTRECSYEHTQEESSKRERHPICRREGEGDAGKELPAPALHFALS